jgi:hypothetical protein
LTWAITFDPRIPVEVVSPFDLDAVVDGTTYHGTRRVSATHFVFVVDDPAETPRHPRRVATSTMLLPASHQRRFIAVPVLIG